MSGDVRHEVRGEAVWLLAERALYWPRAGALVVADPHFGKAAAFRAGGIPIPAGTTAAMLARLDAALDRSGAARLIVLGDLLHARAGRAPRTLATVAAWRAARPNLSITLIRGNHDARAGDPPADWRVECLDAPVEEPPFAWLHEPPAFDERQAASDESGRNDEPQATSDELRTSDRPTRRSSFVTRHYPVAGHIHPAVTLSGGGRVFSLPCFYFGRDYALLPAFGDFTGTAIVRPRSGERVFIVAEGQVIPK